MDAIEQDGNTALHVAAQKGNLEITGFLLRQHSVEVDSRNKVARLSGG